MKRRLVLFDIDGTLLQSAGAGRRAILAALGDTVSNHNAATQVRFDGKTDPQIVTELLSVTGHRLGDQGPTVAEVLDRYLVHLEADVSRPEYQATLLPGVLDLLDRLESLEEIVLGLLTGNVAPGARMKLQAAGLAPERFRVGAYGSDHGTRGALPLIAAQRAEPFFGRVPTGAEVVIIGDTPSDVTCGAGIGARPIAVATGAYTTQVLAEAGAHTVFSSLEDTDAVCQAVLC